MKRFEHTIQRSAGIHAGTARSIIRIARQYPGTTPQTKVCGVRIWNAYSTTASYWMELTTPSVRMMVRVEVVPVRM